MSAQAVKDELLKIWDKGAECSHIHAATAFKILDKMIQDEKDRIAKDNDEDKPL